MPGKMKETVAGPKRIAIGVPEWQPMVDVMSGRPADATYIIQRYLAAGLSARGHKLTFLAPLDLEEMVWATDLQKPLPAPRTWSDSFWFESASKGVWQLQKWLRVPYLNVFSNYRRLDACLQCLPGHDLVYERHGLYRVALAMACRKLKIPYVMFLEADEILEHDFMGKPIRGMLRKRASQMMRYNLRTADCIVCVSEALKDHLTRKWKISQDKIVVFPNAVDVQQFRPDPNARAEVRASLGIGGLPMIMFVGNFFAWHDVTTLLDAFALLRESHPDTRLVLVGDGEEREKAIQRVNDLGIMNAVQFTGLVRHSDVPRLMAAADIGVVPYPQMNRDPWLSPLKLFEYMSSGIAVVASSVGQLNDVIRDRHNGVLVPPGNAGAMARALGCLIDDSALRSRLSRQARRDAVQLHSWENYLSRLERLYTAVIAGEPLNLI
jgi:glycosyltransferase involved in cell wall biosynthesis